MNNAFRLQYVLFKDSNSFERDYYTFSLEGNIGSDVPYTTLIIGPNGTGKSRLLRAIVDIFNDLYNIKTNPPAEKYRPLQQDAYDLSYFIGGNNYVVTFYKDEFEISLNGKTISNADLEIPDVCIAAAYTLHEKFVMNNDSLSRKNSYADKYNPDFYNYLGIKSQNNYAFSSANINKALDLISEAISTEGFNKDIYNVFKFLKFSPAITITYDIRKHYKIFKENISIEDLREYIENIKYNLGFSFGALRKVGIYDNDVLLSRITAALKSVGEYMMSKGNGSRRGKLFEVNLVFLSGHDNSDFSELYKHISLLRKLNIINYGETFVFKNGASYNKYSDKLFANRLELKSLSSGEIHILTSLLSLAAVVKDNSIVLIDEPELSLHPNWQIRYMDLINNIFKKSKGAHFIIATHSHFLVSDLLPSSSAILSLTIDKHEEFGAEILPSAYGWSAESVLYNIFGVSTVRNHYFESDLNKMLHLISIKSRDKEQISRCIERLDRFRIPDNDPLNLLLNEAKRYLEFL